MKLDSEELVLVYSHRSMEDLNSAYELYKKGNYESSASHAQQALEKMFKFVMMKYNQAEPNTKSLKRLGHIPYIGLVNLLKKHNNTVKPKNRVTYLLKLSAHNKLPVLTDIFMGKDMAPVSNKMWWKISLGIRPSEKEAKKARRKIRETLDCLLTELQEITDEFSKTNQKKSGLVSQMFNDVYVDLNSLRDISKNISIKSAALQYLKIQTKIGKIVYNLSSTFFKHNKKYYKEIIAALAISPWAIRHSLTILKITPHLQLGRYPEEINGTNSSRLYEEHADQLYTLIQEVEEVINELYEIGKRA